MPLLEVKHESVAPAEGEALVLFATAQQLEQYTWGLPPKLFEEIGKLKSRGIFAGQSGQTVLLPTFGWIDHDYLLLCGLDFSDGLQTYRVGAANAVRKGLEQRIGTYEIRFPEGGPLEAKDVAQAIAEGFLLGSYRRKTYANSAKKPACLDRVVFRVADGAALESVREGIRKGQIYAEATNYARDLTNLPGNMLVPAQLAEEAAKLAESFGMECTVLEENALREMNMGGLLAVGQGSVHPPRMIALKYQGLEEWKDVIAIVGKGMTFDTGGISLKKSEGMDEMISDMAGAAAVLGVMKALGRLRPKANVLGIIPSAENMPSGGAYKPGDVITTMSGRTIEVLNTDAEGRIILADAVTYAKELGASRLIDLATLTGAILVCLGDVATGAVTNDESFLSELLRASRKTGEKIWQLPAYREFQEMLKSDVADVKNSTGRWGASITAGLFIGTFAEKTPWIHLDIAGTSWLEKDRGVDPKGGTGVMVRTLTEMICLG